jgi:hypothetical protein
VRAFVVMKTNTRLAVIDLIKKIISIYEGKRCLAVYEYEHGSDLTPEAITNLRIAEYKELV